MSKSSRKHYVSFAVLSLFSLAFASFLAVAAYYYVTDGKNMTIKSFAPGVPAFFLFFMALKQWRSARAVSKMERRRAAAKRDPDVNMDELMAVAAERVEAKRKPRASSPDDPDLPPTH